MKIQGLLVRQGDIIKTSRFFYTHYGVYVGKGRVVHFAGDQNNELDPQSGFIQQASIDDFLNNGKIQIEQRSTQGYSRLQTVERALSKVGTAKGEYNLIFNNCEHFANWCKYGTKKSAQVDRAVIGVSAIALVSMIPIIKKIQEIVDDNQTTI
ncbi:MAG: lecithin retinol acyltransferase family protein [Treponemataceae bacterium]